MYSEPEERSIGALIEELARGIVEDALSEPLPVKIEALKVVTTYFVGTKKLGKKGEDDEDGPAPIKMSDMKKQIEGF